MTDVTSLQTLPNKAKIESTKNAIIIKNAKIFHNKCAHIFIKQ